MVDGYKLVNKEVFKNLPFPLEPLYYHIIDEDDNRIAVAYILIFPYTKWSFFTLPGTRCDIISCVTVIDKNTKTLKEIYYWILIGIALGLLIYLGDKYIF